MLQIMTPFLTAKLAGQYVAVDAAGLLLSTLQVTSLALNLCICMVMILLSSTRIKLGNAGSPSSCPGWCIS